MPVTLVGGGGGGEAADTEPPGAVALAYSAS